METKYKYILAALAATVVLAGGAYYYYYTHYKKPVPKQKAAPKDPATKKAPAKKKASAKKKAPAKKKAAAKKKPAQTQAPVDDDNINLFERYLNNAFNSQDDTELFQWLDKLTEPLASQDIIKEVSHLVSICREKPQDLYDNVENFLDKWDDMFPDVPKPCVIELGELSD